MRRLFVLLLAAVSLPILPTSADTSFKQDDQTGCPGPNCQSARFRRCDERPEGLCPLPADRFGNVITEYRINPQMPNPDSKVTEAEVIRTIRYVVRTWEYASPRLRFVYKGTTDRLPIPGDGQNVIGFTRLMGDHVSISPFEWDISLIVTSAASYPCRLKCDAIKPTHVLDVNREMPSMRQDGIEYGGFDHQLIRHLGLVLGLDHPEEGGCTTMGPWTETGCDPYIDSWTVGKEPRMARWYGSLALGEMRAMAELYPYECPKAPVGYREGADWKPAKKIKARNWLPWRYRQVCPSIIIGTP
ncbi:MAG: hypothetical protein ACLGH3_05325 [Actinomycetota bacterium]